MPERKESSRFRVLAGLHVLLLFYASGGYFSKRAAASAFLSPEYLENYFVVLCILAVYALFWQILLKKLPLTIAMANKSITVVWGMVYGVIFFKEKISWSDLAGAALIIAGICLVSGGEPQEGDE